MRSPVARRIQQVWWIKALWRDVVADFEVLYPHQSVNEMTPAQILSRAYRLMYREGTAVRAQLQMWLKREEKRQKDGVTTVTRNTGEKRRLSPSQQRKRAAEEVAHRG